LGVRLDKGDLQLIIRDYVIKEVLRAFTGVFLVLFLILLSTQLLRALSAVAEGKIALDFLFSLIILKNLESLTLILPLTLFLAILLALSRLYKDSEMIALSACGIGPGSLLKSILMIVFSFAFIEIALSMVISPWASHKMQYEEEMFKADAELELVSAGQFNLVNKGQRVLYAETMPDQTQLENVFLYIENKKSQSVMASDQAIIKTDKKEGARYVVFKNGNRYDGIPGSLNYRTVAYQEYGVLMQGKLPEDIIPDKGSMTTLALLNSEELNHKAELHWRMGQIIMMIILAMIAVPLSKTAPRQGRYAKMAVAILLYIVYSNLLVVAINWLKKGMLPPSAGIWWVHILFLLLFLILFSRQTGKRHSFLSANKKRHQETKEFDKLVES